MGKDDLRFNHWLRGVGGNLGLAGSWRKLDVTSQITFLIFQSAICRFQNHSILVNRVSCLDHFRLLFFAIFSLCLRASDDRLEWHRWQDTGKSSWRFWFSLPVSTEAGHGPLRGGS